MQIDRAGLEAWQRDQPLSILQLDPADRAVLRVAGWSDFFLLLTVLSEFEVCSISRIGPSQISVTSMGVGQA